MLALPLGGTSQGTRVHVCVDMTQAHEEGTQQVLDAELWERRGKISFPVKWFGVKSCHLGMSGGVRGASPDRTLLLLLHV